MAKEILREDREREKERNGINNCVREKRGIQREKMRYGKENGEQRKKEENTRGKGKEKYICRCICICICI